LVTAFSRDGAEKYYVQHALQEHADALRDWMAQGAHVYVCGNKQHLERAIGAAFDALLTDAQQGAAQPDESPWQRLGLEGRVHLELY
ncbi:MAG: sulfite reductase flavoprotein subunit alpha, partial [Comamonadaceae bacterium]|nr:sulfite reductase flavoprotein subunit alpha [Comamonadaceae bacterium]